jgi:hypothetical protein
MTIPSMNMDISKSAENSHIISIMKEARGSTMRVLCRKLAYNHHHEGGQGVCYARSWAMSKTAANISLKIHIMKVLS